MSTFSAAATNEVVKEDLALPLEVIDNCIGKKIWVVLKTKKEYLGTLVGFDEFVNIVLDNCQEFEMQSDGAYICEDVGQILLNSNAICLLIPEGKGPI